MQLTRPVPPFALAVLPEGLSKYDTCGPTLGRVYDTIWMEYLVRDVRSVFGCFQAKGRRPTAVTWQQHHLTTT